MHTPETLHCLNALGFLGGWQIDYESGRFRASGKIGDLFGFSRTRMRDGVSLSLIEKSYPEKDLEAIKEKRRSIFNDRLIHLRECGVRSAKTQHVLPVLCFGLNIADRSSRLIEARGVLFDLSSPPDRQEARTSDTEIALCSLRDATLAVGALGYDHLTPMLRVIFREVAQDAIRQELNIL